MLELPWKLPASVLQCAVGSMGQSILQETDSPDLRIPEGGIVRGHLGGPLSHSHSWPCHMQDVLSPSQGPPSLVLVKRQFIQTRSILTRLLEPSNPLLFDMKFIN